MTFFALFYLWRNYGRDPKGRGVIVPEYLPPKDASVLVSSVILNDRMPQETLSAQLIGLAVRRYLTIYETHAKKDKRLVEYEVELARDISGLPAEEQAAATVFFGKNAETGARIHLSNPSSQRHKKVEKLGKQAKAKALGSGLMVDTKKRRKTIKGIGTLHFVASLIPVVVGLVILAANWGDGLGATWLLLALGMGVAAVFCMVFARIMPARTRQGVVLRDYLYGLKMYMQLAEAERIRYLQSPRGVSRAGIVAKSKEQRAKGAVVRKIIAVCHAVWH